MKRILVFLMALAIVFGFSVQAHATSTFAELNFRSPAFYENTSGTNTASLSHTGEGSTAWFTADAATGTVRAFADSAEREIGDLRGFDSVWAKGSVNDSFTLNGPAPGTPVNLTAYFTLDGTLVSSRAGAPYTASAYDNAYVATQFTAPTGRGGGNDLFALWAREDSGMSDCWENGCSGFSIPVHRVASLTLDIYAGQPFDVFYSLFAHGGWAYGGSGGTSDFGSTGAISFALPAGTWITSDGGYTQSVVPEPSTLLLLGLGIVGLIGLKRKHLG